MLAGKTFYRLVIGIEAGIIDRFYTVLPVILLFFHQVPGCDNVFVIKLAGSGKCGYKKEKQKTNRFHGADNVKCIVLMVQAVQNFPENSLFPYF